MEPADQITQTHPDREVANGYIRHTRQIMLPQRYAYAEVVPFALTIASEIEVIEPRSYKEAVHSKKEKKRKVAMDEEMSSLLKNNTWQLVL